MKLLGPQAEIPSISRETCRDAGPNLFVIHYVRVPRILLGPPGPLMAWRGSRPCHPMRRPGPPRPQPRPCRCGLPCAARAPRGPTLCGRWRGRRSCTFAALVVLEHALPDGHSLAPTRLAVAVILIVEVCALQGFGSRGRVWSQVSLANAHPVSYLSLSPIRYRRALRTGY